MENLNPISQEKILNNFVDLHCGNNYSQINQKIIPKDIVFTPYYLLGSIAFTLILWIGKMSLDNENFKNTITNVLQVLRIILSLIVPLMVISCIALVIIYLSNALSYGTCKSVVDSTINTPIRNDMLRGSVSIVEFIIGSSLSQHLKGLIALCNELLVEYFLLRITIEAFIKRNWVDMSLLVFLCSIFAVHSYSNENAHRGVQFLCYIIAAKLIQVYLEALIHLQPIPKVSPNSQGSIVEADKDEDEFDVNDE